MEHSFPCGNPALDFVGTLQARREPAPTEKLGSPTSLDSWFREGGIVDGELNSQSWDLQEATALREAIYSIVTARIAGGQYEEDALSLVNRAAQAPPVTLQLTPEGRRMDATPGQAMSSVARVAIDLVSGADAALLKECSRPGCTQVYLDRSRGARREWCSMDPCGNMIKAAAYRARKRAKQTV